MRRFLGAWQFGLSTFQLGHLRWVGSRQYSQSCDDDDDELVRQLIQDSDVELSLAKLVDRPKPAAVTELLPAIPLDVTPVPPSATQPAVASSSRGESASRASLFVRIRTTASGVLEWQCLLCSTHNHVLRQSCRGCSASSHSSQKDAQPTPSRFVATMPPAWVCTVPTCRTINVHDPNNALSNRGRYFCKECHEPFKGVHEWICAECNTPNPRGVNQCSGCYSNRSVCWTCPTCKCDTNCIFSVSCATCSYQREPQTTSSRGVQCPSCKAPALLNWELCSVCLAPLKHMSLVLGAAPSVDSKSSFQRLSWAAEGVHDNATPLAVADKVKIPPAEVVASVLPAAANPPPQAASPAKTVSSLSSITTIHHRKHHVDLKPYNSQDSSTSWRCPSCGLWSRSIAGFCDICLTSRSESVTHPAATPPVSPHAHNIINGWECRKCLSVSTPFSRVCTVCNTVRQVPEGYWQCVTCNSINRNSRLACLGCFNVRPTSDFSQAFFTVCTTGTIAAGTATWTCLGCNFDGNRHSLLKCSSCGMDRNGWTCQCSGSNQISHDTCSQCEGQRKLPSDQVDRFGWTCDKCGCDENNEMISCACKKCGLSSRAQRHPKWLWNCGQCQNINAVNAEHLPDVVECHRCEKRTKASDVPATHPSWSCRSCHTTIPIYIAHCTTCNAKRTAHWKSPIECTSCHKRCIPLASESCPHCGESLSSALSLLWSPVSLDAHVGKDVKWSKKPQSLAGHTAEYLQGWEEDEAAEADDGDDNDGDNDEEGLGIVGASESESLNDGSSTQVVLSQNIDAGIGRDISSWSCVLCGKTNAAAHSHCFNCSMPKDL